MLPLVTQVSEQGLALKEWKCQAPQECALGTYIAVLGHVLSKLEFICITSFLSGFFGHCLRQMYNKNHHLKVYIYTNSPEKISLLLYYGHNCCGGNHRSPTGFEAHSTGGNPHHFMGSEMALSIPDPKGLKSANLHWRSPRRMNGVHP